MLRAYIRKANQGEIDFFENTLYPLQDELLRLIQTDKFYLSGGTCLSRFYFDHRYSEDLDFFYNGYQYPKEDFHIVFREIVNRISKSFETEINIDGEYFKRGFVYNQDVILKIEFIYENYKVIGQRELRNGVYIDSKENIATNKITAIYDRKTAKDFVDLYYLMQEIQFEQVIEWAKYKIVPLDYEGVLLAFSDYDLEGKVIMKRDLPFHEFEHFVYKLIKQMIDHAKKSS